MSDHLVRVENLKALQRARGWDDSELARQCRRSPQQVHSWFSTGPAGRQIGERLARGLEAALGLNRYTLDDRGQSHTSAPHPPSEWGFKPAGGVTNRPRDMPVLLWVEIENMLNTDNYALKSRAPHLETYAAGSSRCKFLAMPDDSMAPEIEAGDHVLFDPAEVPHAGDVVLVRCGAEYFVRTFRPRTAHAFDAAPVNANFQPLSSANDAAEVVAVMVEHRRYRRST